MEAEREGFLQEARRADQGHAEARGGVREQGRAWAVCPNHEDGSPSPSARDALNNV